MQITTRICNGPSTGWVGWFREKGWAIQTHLYTLRIPSFEQKLPAATVCVSVCLSVSARERVKRGWTGMRWVVSVYRVRLGGEAEQNYVEQCQMLFLTLQNKITKYKKNTQCRTSRKIRRPTFLRRQY